MATFDLLPPDLAWGDYEAETTERIFSGCWYNNQSSLSQLHKMPTYCHHVEIVATILQRCFRVFRDKVGETQEIAT